MRISVVIDDKLVDSSVRIDYFGGRVAPQTDLLHAALAELWRLHSDRDFDPFEAHLVACGPLKRTLGRSLSHPHKLLVFRSLAGLALLSKTGGTADKRR